MGVSDPVRCFRTTVKRSSMNGCRPAKCQRPSRVDGSVQGLKTREGSKVFKEVKFVIRGQIPSGVKIPFTCMGVQHGKSETTQSEEGVSISRRSVSEPDYSEVGIHVVRRGVTSQIRGEEGNYSGSGSRLVIYRGFYQILNILRLTGARILTGEEIIYKYEKEKNRIGPMIL